MESRRINAYLDLIEKLLKSPSEDALGLLKANQDLLGSEFVKSCFIVSQDLDQQGLRKQAAWLRQIATQLTPSTQSRNHDSNDAELAFLLQLLQLQQDVLQGDSDPSAVHSLIRTRLSCVNPNLGQLLRQWFYDAILTSDLLHKLAIARLTGALGNSLLQFTHGSPKIYKELAAAAYSLALQVIREAELPEEWASFMNNLGVAFYDLSEHSEKKQEMLAKAIEAYNNALRVRTESDYPRLWAMTTTNIGNAYLRFAHGKENPSEMLEKAISALTSTLRIFSEHKYPKDWAIINNNLGTPYTELAKYSQNPLLQFEKAVIAYTNAFMVISKDTEPKSWAILSTNLGNTYRDMARFTRTPCESLENAKSSYANALIVFTEQEHPQAWARTCDNLGKTYMAMAEYKWFPREALEQAIACFINALRVRTEADYLHEWASTSSHLSDAYRKLSDYSENPIEVIEKSIATDSSVIRTSASLVNGEVFAASANCNLGLDYIALARYSRHPREPLQKAIAAFLAWLKVFTEHDRPIEWASIHIELSNAYHELSGHSDDARELLEKALHGYNCALRIFTRAEHSEDWANVNHGLGNIYRGLAAYSENPAVMNENAMVAYVKALSEFDPINRSLQCLRTAATLADLGYSIGLFDIATEYYSLAITAVENIRLSALTPAHKSEVISRYIEVYGNLVQIYVSQERYDKALEVADRSKARNLVELLANRDYMPRGEIPPEVVSRLRSLRNAIVRAERKIIRGPGETIHETARQILDEGGTGELSKLKQELNKLIDDQIKGKDPSFTLERVNPLCFSQLQNILPDEKAALVSWYFARDELVAFIFTKDATHPICHRYRTLPFSFLTDEISAYLKLYASNPSKWRQSLDDTLQHLSNLLEIESIASSVAQVAPKADQLILVPHRLLHSLPLQCLPFGQSKNTLLDQFPRGVRFMPSLQVMQIVQPRYQQSNHSLFAIQNPGNDLNYSDLEVKCIVKNFASHSFVLNHDAATREGLLSRADVLAQSQYIHFACHGTFNLQSPALSSLKLTGSPSQCDSGDSEADDKDALTLLDIFELDLTQTNLVTLSACETALTEQNSLSDEFTGLSSGFLYAGANSVVGSLWKVDDISTSLLMTKFYATLMEKYTDGHSTDIAATLSFAQRWLRDLTREDAIVELQNMIADLPPCQRNKYSHDIIELEQCYGSDECPFGSPIFWAAFCVVGQ